MEVTVNQNDANWLLNQKNEQSEEVINKYRVAGQIAQTGLKHVIALINESYHLAKTKRPYTVQELCIMGDSLMGETLGKVYTNTVREKGISQPTSIEVNDIVANFSPEVDSADVIFQQGDLVTVNVGIHIDGYTANGAHTLVIYPPGVEIDNDIRPEGPLLGGKADAICASNVATEATIALLGTALHPEKCPPQLNPDNNKAITGKQIRALVDEIANSFKCIVVPGSKVRRVRRFLAGQSEGIVAEKGFKGVVWTERDQEDYLLRKFANLENLPENRELVHQKDEKKLEQNTEVPTDDFMIQIGEVYQVDIRMAPIGDLDKLGLVTLKEIDEFSGTNNRTDDFNCKPTIFVRDYAVSYQLKLKKARSLLGQIDKEYTVYPFKLSHVSDVFPLESLEEIPRLRESLSANRLGLAELTNRHLVNARPVQVARFLPFEYILNSTNPTGKLGFDANKPLLPGLEIPLPQLGFSALKLKSLLKKSSPIPVARELSTVFLSSLNNSYELIRLTGGKPFPPSWVHSRYQLLEVYSPPIMELLNLLNDSRFGVKVRQCQPMRSLPSQLLSQLMQLD